jgi:hypothetical protein
MFLLLLLGASITAMVEPTGCGADSNGHSSQLQQTYHVTVTGNAGAAMNSRHAPAASGSKDDILNWVTRFPEMTDKVCTWEQQVGRLLRAVRPWHDHQLDR